jgi:hypothetical protein
MTDLLSRISRLREERDALTKQIAILMSELRKRDRKKADVQTSQAIRQRNTKIMRMRKRGATLKTLAQHLNLNPDQVRRIMMLGSRKHGG